MKIGIISDTHNVLREDVIQHLVGCDYIIHAGDVCNQAIVEQLNTLAKTFFVKGNNDKGDFFDSFPSYLEVELDEILLYVVHDQKDFPPSLAGIDVVIYGNRNFIND